MTMLVTLLFSHLAAAMVGAWGWQKYKRRAAAAVDLAAK